MRLDTASYNKAMRYPPGHGYEARKAAPTAIVVHSTSSSTRNTAFESEAKYLYEAALVSAHYLIGKDGQAVQFLDPLSWAAWHAGNARVAWVNAKSIGVELHHSVGDPPYPPEQLNALSELLRDLMSHFAISPALIETHGQIAIRGPYIRKHDPSDWVYQDFLSFRSHLVTPPALHTVIAGPHGALAQQSREPQALAAKYYPPDTPIVCDDLTGSYWHVAVGDGFIPSGQVEA